MQVPANIRQHGIVTDGGYPQADFVREVQMCTGAGIDGQAGSETLKKTITVSQRKNNKHNVVLPLQKALKKCGMYTGELDRSTGPKFKAAVDTYQRTVCGSSRSDGEVTAGQRMWRSLLGM